MGAPLKWAYGIGGTWLVLTILADFEGTRKLAVAFAVVIMGSVVLSQGPAALANLGFGSPPAPVGAQPGGQ